MGEESRPTSSGGAVRRLLVSGDRAGDRLDVFLARELAISRAQVRRLLARGGVRHGERVLGESDKGQPLSAGGEYVVLAFRPPSEQAPRPEPPGTGPALRRLAEGDGWVVIDKPAGMPVHPLREDETGTVLNALCADHAEIMGVGEGGLRSGVVHRLDVWTSGALVVATRPAAWERLRSAFADHRVTKRYWALVEGVMPAAYAESQRMECGLVMARHRPARVRVVADHEADGPAVRHIDQDIRLLEQFADASLVEIRPRTGFLHQIRVTLAHLGHPVIGDKTYASASSVIARGVGADRHMLHAAHVAVDELSADSPVPADFESCRVALLDSGDAGAEAKGRESE